MAAVLLEARPLKRVFVLLLTAVGVAGFVQTGSKSIAHDAHHGGQWTQDSVVSKVIELLAKEKETVAQDVKAEAAEMEEYLEYCDDEQKEKEYAIRDSSRKVDDLSALIEDNTAHIKAADVEILELGQELSRKEVDFKKVGELRSNRHEEFKKREHEQTIMVAELADMGAALKRQIESMTTPPPLAELEEESLLQLNPRNRKTSSLLQLGAEAPSGIMDMTLGELNRMRAIFTRSVAAMDPDPVVSSRDSALLQGGQDPSDALEAQTASTADNLAVFENLKSKAEASLQREREAEQQEAHEYLVDKQAFMGQEKLINSKLDDANERREQKSEEMARAAGERTAAEATKDADEKYLASLNTECHSVSVSWDKRQKEAEAEQASISKAMEILGSRVKVFLQGAKSPGSRDAENRRMLQEDSDGTKAAKVRQQLITAFRNMGASMGSLSMLNMATVVAVQPTDNIKGLIKQMIEKLQREAAEAASTHGFCQEENRKNAEAKETAKGKIEKVQNRLDAASSTKEQLEDSIAELQGEVKDIEEANVQALKLRTEQHDNFVKQEKDFKEAADAVDDAIESLKDYYGDTTALVQAERSHATTVAVAPPKLGGASMASAGGILSILDMVSGKFESAVLQLQHQERADKGSYERMKNENEASKAAKMAEIKAMESQVMSLTVAIGESQGDYRMSEKALAAVLEYIDKLKPTCEHRVVPYAQRKAKREAEIEGLKEAFQMLVEATGAGSFLQKKN